ncbi:hypothetical protein OG21DRAFT_840468 [Imleria badia]|nr:hypothetical protein OG21DRAFT_840468 [Imleria badia]
MKVGEKKDRYDDALNTTRVTVEEGICSDLRHTQVDTCTRRSPKGSGRIQHSNCVLHVHSTHCALSGPGASACTHPRPSVWPRCTLRAPRSCQYLAHPLRDFKFFATDKPFANCCNAFSPVP